MFFCSIKCSRNGIARAINTQQSTAKTIYMKSSSVYLVAIFVCVTFQFIQLFFLFFYFYFFFSEYNLFVTVYTVLAMHSALSQIKLFGKTIVSLPILLYGPDSFEVWYPRMCEIRTKLQVRFYKIRVLNWSKSNPCDVVLQRGKYFIWTALSWP